MHLSAEQFEKLVYDIDDEHDGALSYEKFADYFDKENASMNAEYLTCEVELARSLWDVVDADNSGSLDRDEVRSLFKSLGEDLSYKELDAAFASMDADGSGVVEFNEFEGWFESQHKDEMKGALEVKSSVQGAWAKVNPSGAAELGQTEISELFGLMGRCTVQQCFVKEFRTIDIDNSGAISYDELVEWWTKQCKSEREWTLGLLDSRCLLLLCARFD